MIPKPYYEEHKEYLSEKLKDQYDTNKGDMIILIFFAICVLIALGL